MIDVLMFGHKHVSEEWNNMSGIKYVLASDNSPGKDWAREITGICLDMGKNPTIL